MRGEMSRSGLREGLGGLGNLVEMVQHSAGRRVGVTACADKRRGEWHEVTYARLFERVERFAAGLASLGIGEGDRVALMSTNRTEWPVSDLAIQSLRAITVPVYPTLEAGQVSHILNDSGARAVIVEDEGLLRRVEGVRDETPGLEEVIVMDDASGGESARRFAEVEWMGERSPVSGWEDGWRVLGRDDVATIIYTSGTTGPPKGAMLTHGNFLSNLEGTMEALPLYPEDTFLSCLPLSHVFERTAGQYLALALGATTCYAESMQKVPENLREVRPTVILSVPRLYEKMYDRVRQQASEGSALRRRLFESAIEAGRKKYAVEKEGGTVGRGLEIRLELYDRLVFSKIREAFGGRLRFFVSGGAKLGAEVGEFFYAAGVKIVEGYGLTETSPIISANRLERIRFGTVGPPLHNVEVRIASDGEIQTRGPHVMRGYLNNDAATAEAFTGDGWYRTGDIGEFDEAGYLQVTDRAKNLIVLSTGKNVAPQTVETALSSAPHITQSVVLGDGRKYVSALIVPDYDAVRASLGVDDSDEDLASDERAREIVQSEMDEATRGFAGYERPKTFVLLPRELSQERGELTPTLKVKLGVVRKRYSEEVESLYA